MKRGASSVIIDLAIKTGKDKKKSNWQKRAHEYAKKCARDAKKEGDYLRRKGLI